ncbi:MAG: hypothetical protein A4E27_00158 [Methanobacterium sp. PtaU1.Bin242]|nr:MAG: hypothetical protein A4E27_00158 [Methanobacterium sp. PtaU1.Bin242]
MICIDLADVLGITEDMSDEEVKKRCYEHCYNLDKAIWDGI